MEVRFEKPFDGWGRFWFPGDTDRPASGRLIYDPASGITIEITGEPAPLGFSVHARQHPAIYGRLMSGDLVTLTDAFMTSQRIGAGGTGPVTIRANKAVFGTHVPNLDQMSVKSCSLGLADLGEWLGIRSITSEDARSDDQSIGVDLHYREPPKINIEIPNAGFTLSINWKLHTTYSRDLEVALRPEAYPTITARDSFTFAACNTTAWELQCLMALLMGRMPFVRWMSVKCPVAEAGSPPPPECFILYHQRVQPKAESLFANEMLLPYSVAMPCFGDIAKKWFARTEQAKLAAHIYFGSLLQVSPTLELRLLAVMQAIESYHRSLGTGLYMQQDEYDKLWKKIAEGIPKEIDADQRQSLKKRLEHGNEYSQRKRLGIMLKKLPKVLGDKIVAGDASRFIERVVNTRNYFTHCDFKSKAKALSGMNVVNASERLRILLVASIFSDLGLSQETFVAAIERDKNFSWWLEQPLTL